MQIDVEIQNQSGNRQRWVRPVVQAGFLIFSILIGLQFGGFVRFLEDPSRGVAERPPAVEGFLPISSLMSLVYLLQTGVANSVRPAGLVIFTLTLVLAVLARRGFCSWACPVGMIAEYAHQAGRLIFGRNPAIPRGLDVPLRLIKYGLLGFFSYAILRMSADQLRGFIHGPYNRIADVKMYLFFADLGPTAVVVLLVLAVLSLVFKNFWCRYLCPYGALLGLLSFFSPTAVRRDESNCIKCGRCARACPNRIAVNRKTVVRSPECLVCYECVGACPAPKALGLSVGRPRWRIYPVVYAMITVGAFLFAAQIATTFNYWQTDTPVATYRWWYQNIVQIKHPSLTGFESSFAPADRRSGFHHREIPPPDQEASRRGMNFSE